MQSKIWIFILMVIWSCSDSQPNPFQVDATHQKMDCYEVIFEKIRSAQTIQDQLLQIRDAKKRGRKDPMTVDQNYRLIALEELPESLQHQIGMDCLKRIAQEDDFQGIRLIHSDCIIIEIDHFRRRTLAEHYGSRNTKEFHRLIQCSDAVETQKYFFGTEKRIWLDSISAEINYEISQIRTYTY